MADVRFQVKPNSRATWICPNCSSSQTAEVKQYLNITQARMEWEVHCVCQDVSTGQPYYQQYFGSVPLQ